jgi:hypothetical protein
MGPLKGLARSEKGRVKRREPVRVWTKVLKSGIKGGRVKNRLKMT